jgi:FtsZ-interacting cell division protein YlmF
MNQNAEAEEYDDAPSRDGGVIGRILSHFRGHDDDPDDPEPVTVEHPQPQPMPAQTRASGGSYSPLRRGTTLRMDQTRQTHITVRRAIQTFDDARRAADGLKDGQQQIVNLEQTSNDMTERIIDFLNGATYALDGSVEKIGEQVYLFTPSSVVIDIEDKPVTGVRAAIFDRD